MTNWSRRNELDRNFTNRNNRHRADLHRVALAQSGENVMEELALLMKAVQGRAGCSLTQYQGGGYSVNVYTLGVDDKIDFRVKGDDVSAVAKDAYAKALALGLTNDV